MGSSSPKPVETTSVQNSEPWSAQQPYLKEGFSEYQRLYNSAQPNFYPGQTYANPDPATTAALNATENRAVTGNPLVPQAQGEMSKILSGAYLDPNTNPGFQSMLDTVKANTLPSIDSQFISTGRTGSGLHGRAIGEGLGSAIGNLTYQNYGAERNNMIGAMNAAPTLAQADYADPQALAAVGAAREAQSQQGINEDIARYDYGQTQPWEALARYMQGVSGNYGGTTTGVTTQYLPQQSTLGNVLGGLMSGVGILGGTGAFGATGWLSDERTKKDIKRVGETDDGLPIYTYRYKFGGPPMMGVMAQDVAEVKPEALGPMAGPFLTVNYEAL